MSQERKYVIAVDVPLHLITGPDTDPFVNLGTLTVDEFLAIKGPRKRLYWLSPGCGLTYKQKEAFRYTREDALRETDGIRDFMHIVKLVPKKKNSQFTKEVTDFSVETMKMVGGENPSREDIRLMLESLIDDMGNKGMAQHLLASGFEMNGGKRPCRICEEVRQALKDADPTRLAVMDEIRAERGL